MSEQNKSNFQTLAAGFAGFAAVMVLGGGALMLQRSHQAKQAAHPVAAAAPIDLGAAMPRPMTSVGALKERREESPAPLIGNHEAIESVPVRETPQAAAAKAAANPAASQAANQAAPQGAPAAAAQAAASTLETSEHLASTGDGSTAEASVKNTLHKTASKSAKARKGATSATAGAKPEADAIASVHYGVTNRNELMGRAAGPVYNFQGANKGGGTAANGKLAADAKTQIADIKKQLEGANLPPEQRAALLKQLDAAGESAPQ